MYYTSRFTYNPDGANGTESDFVNSMKFTYDPDPAHSYPIYGDIGTTFTKYEGPVNPPPPSPPGAIGWYRALEIVYPDGGGEYVEFNQYPYASDHPPPFPSEWNPFPNYPNVSIPFSDPLKSVPNSGMTTKNQFLYYRNTFHWDRQAYAQAKLINPGDDGTGRNSTPGYAFDYTKATIYHWLHNEELVGHIGPISPAGILESFKKPLEGRIWYDYTGQSSISGPIVVGNTSRPNHVGRVLDNGSTQVYTYEYNDFGKITNIVDPLGRTFSYDYANNGIDLQAMRQTQARQNEVLFTIQYDPQ